MSDSAPRAVPGVAEASAVKICVGGMDWVEVTSAKDLAFRRTGKDGAAVRPMSQVTDEKSAV